MSSESVQAEIATEFGAFLKTFNQSRGACAIVIITTLLSVGVGCVIGLIPETLADRYAKLDYQFTGQHCDDYDVKPEACVRGLDAAQSSAACANMVSCFIMLLANPVLGSISDTKGRKPVLLVCFGLACIPAAVFVLLQRLPHMHPQWYYASTILMGTGGYLSILFASMSDLIPSHFRSQSYGLLLAGAYGGYAIAPSLAVVLDDLIVGMASFIISVLSFLAVGLCLSETLSESVREENQQRQRNERRREMQEGSFRHKIVNIAGRPFRDMSILNRNWAIRLLSVGSFFAAMVFASDATLFFYYVEEELDVGPKDIAKMMFIMGIVGIVVQGALLQPLIELLGERGLLVASFVSGGIHNLMYGVAKTKSLLYVALCFSQITKLNMPLLSSVASKMGNENEQGRVQGALFAANAVASAIGPSTMEYLYKLTENGKHFGPGFMFIYAAGLYLIGTIAVALIPRSPLAGRAGDDQEGNSSEYRNDLEEPFLDRDDSSTDTFE